MKKVISVTNERGMVFNVRILSKGDKYGRNNMLTYDKDTECIEFYDDRYKDSTYFDSKLGQFISRYYIDSILDHIGGLCLDGMVDDWNVSSENISDIKIFILRYIIMQK